LRDDYDGIVSILEWTLEILDSFVLDRRLEEVVRDVTLMAGRTRKSYKGHTPNMVAFSSLIDAIHSFCQENEVVPKAFVHDPQSEFGPTMKEYHEIFSRMRIPRSSSGLLARGEKIGYDLGKFSLTPSKHLTCLQAVDLFIWLSQRIERIKSPGLRQSLLDKTNPFYISRASSEMMTFAWFHKLSTADFTEQQIKEAKEMIEKMESTHKNKLKEFLSRE